MSFMVALTAKYKPDSNFADAYISLSETRFVDFALHYGQVLKQVTVQYLIAGNPTGPVLVVQGGISADRNLIDTQESGGWWSKLVGYEGHIDLSYYQVISINYIAPEADVLIASHDQARAVKLLLEQLSISKIHAFIGASYGGLVGQAFASLYPESLDKFVCVCAAAENNNQAIAQRAIQRKIIESVADGKKAMQLARSIALLGYRGEDELAYRFSNRPLIKGQAVSFEVINYLEHNANKFAQSFNKNRYLKLSLSIDLHQVNLSKIRCQCLFIAFDSDQIVSVNAIKNTSDAISHSNLKIIHTHYGHDAFLIEYQELGKQITSFLWN